MTSSNEIPRKPRRVLWWVALLLLVMFGLYSAGWFWLADRLRSETAARIAALDARGIRASCVNMQVSGYPLRLDVTCDAMAYEDDAGNVAASAGSLNAAASLPFPWLPTAEMRGPLRTMSPGMTPLWIDWDRLQAGARLSWPLPKRVSLDAEGLSGQTDPQDDTDPVQLFSIGNAAAVVQPIGTDLDYSGSFADLEIDAEAVGGRALPPLDGNVRATLKDGIALLASNTRSLRGHTVEIAGAELSSGEARVSVSGPVTIGTDGLIDAALTVRLHNPKAVAEVLAGALPEKAGQIRQGVGVLAMLGNEPSLPLNVVKGKATLGFIPLGEIKPVQ
ncbi:DUF2125 domain-containing protein [Mesorhizobium sp. PUT5]|uniref:DUF2125 domain-containing protein n=1 Tax=Mesorhizobium sp. PUT5 TaxID=3454629 RepID=UPI003FA4312D